MKHRSIVLGIAGLVAVAALAAFAFFSMSGAPTAHAEEGHGISGLQCSASPSPVTVNTAEELTCTFSFRGTPHTFVADFTISASVPHLNVSSCTLDGNAVHIGPCP
jgi:hypothetical protein